MQRAFAAVVVATLVVLAGCSAVFDGGSTDESTPTITPMAVPTDEPTPTPVSRLAPGLTGQGIENTSALVAAHTARLRNTSFVTRANTTGLTTNGSVVFRQTDTLRAGPPGSGVYSVTELNGSPSSSSLAAPVHTAVWSNEKWLVVNRTYANGTSRYDRFNSTGLRYGASGSGLRDILEPFGTANTSVTELERSGTTLYRVRGRVRDAERGNVSVRLIADASGLIHKYRTSQRTTFGENVSRIVSERRFSRIGTADAPERLSWIDEALNRTTSTSDRTTATSNATSATSRAGTTSDETASVSAATTSSR